MREPLLVVSDGRIQIGAVFQKQTQFEGVMVDGRSLGLFNKPQAAARAVSHEWHVARHAGEVLG